jgi:hypothetical protein
MTTIKSAVKSYNLTATKAIWIAIANLHSKFPEAEGFTPYEIEIEVSRLHLFEKDPSTITQHINQHLVATKRANAKPRRMLTELPSGKRRLFIEGDPYDASRSNSEIHPRLEDIPLEFRPLLLWYEEWSRGRSGQGRPSPERDPLLALAGTWTFGDADTYLREHRSGWEE